MGQFTCMLLNLRKELTIDLLLELWANWASIYDLIGSFGS